MDEIREPGAVLRVVPYGEADLVLHVLTLDHGPVTLFARGARARRPRFGAVPSPFDVGLFRWRPRPRGMGALMGLDLDAAGLRLARDPGTAAAAALASEAILHLCHEQDPCPPVHHLYTTLLDQLAGGLAWALAPFFARLLVVTGLSPELGRCVRCQAQVPEGRSILVYHLHGGTLCGRCRSHTEGSWRLGPDQWAYLEAIQAGVEPGEPLDAEGIVSFLVWWVQHQTGRALNAWEVYRDLEVTARR